MIKFKKGFTLIELLVVVAIIGILAAVGVVAYNNFTENTKINVLKSNHQNIVKVIKTTYTYCATGAPSLKLSKNVTIDCSNKDSSNIIGQFRTYTDDIGMKNPYTGYPAHDPRGGRWNGMSTGCCGKNGQSWINIHTFWKIGASKPDLEDLIYWEQ